jgi:hypothetical protein
LLTLLALGAIAFVWTAVALVQAKSDLTVARDLLESVEDAEDPTSMLPQLVAAEARLQQAGARLRQPGPRVVSALPVVGRTVLAVRTVADAGAAVVAGGRDVLDAVPDRLFVGGRLDLEGADRVESALRAAAARAVPPTARLDALDLAGTPGSVAAGARQARRLLSGVPGTLLRAADGLAALQGVLGEDRDRRLLVVLQNNAELRATGGLVSVFAQATASNGRLELGAFQEVSEVADPAETARRVPAPEDYVQLYGPLLADTTLWQNVNMAADVPTSSAVLAEVAAATLPHRPDAILWVDVPGIAAVLRATGPVDLPDGSRLTADNTVPRLLSEAYLRGEDLGSQERRQDELRAAGDAVISQILDPRAEVAAADLARELASAAEGRHLALWSADPAEQQLLVAARLAGQVRAQAGDVSSFTVHNLGDGNRFGNKLDFYGRRQVTVRVIIDQDTASVEQEFAVRNIAPAAGLPVYVSGKVNPGRAHHLVSMALPASAEQVELSRDGVPVRIARQPLLDHQVILAAATIPPSSTVRWRLRYRLPLTDGRYTSRLLPQPLAVDAGLLLQVTAADGRELADGPVQYSGPYDSVVRVDVAVRARSGWDRAREAVGRFWNEPVRLP